jgi:hypothetical protein
MVLRRAMVQEGERRRRSSSSNLSSGRSSSSRSIAPCFVQLQISELIVLLLVMAPCFLASVAAVAVASRKSYVVYLGESDAALQHPDSVTAQHHNLLRSACGR